MRWYHLEVLICLYHACMRCMQVHSAEYDPFSYHARCSRDDACNDSLHFTISTPPPPPVPPQCSSRSQFDVVNKRVIKVCCNEPGESCGTGIPDTCNADCAAVLVPAAQACTDPGGFLTHHSMLIAKNAFVTAAAKCAHLRNKQTNPAPPPPPPLSISWEGRKACFNAQYPYSRCCGEGPQGSCWLGKINYDT